MMAESYVYGSLGASEIRILRIFRKEYSKGVGRDQDLFCRLEHISLDDAAGSYAGLSYTWGEMGPGKTITIVLEEGEASFQIQENLYDALLVLRAEDMDRLVWADAVCINQANDVEKSIQVQQMRQVYQNAVATLVWLGNAADDSDMAFDSMRNLGALYEEGVKGTWVEMQAKINTKNDSEATFPCEAMIALFSRPRFSRIWVTRDVVLRKAEKTEYESRLTQPLDGHPMSILFQLPCHIRSGPMPLRKWFDECYVSYAGDDRPLRATDPRDLVYAILGIASDVNELGIISDYTKSVKETYIELAKAFIRHGDLGIFGFIEQSQISLGLPSWVPDWRTAPIKVPLQFSSMDPGQTDASLEITNSPWAHEDYRSYSASGDTAVAATFKEGSDGSSILSLKAIILDTVHGTAATIIRKGEQVTYDLILRMAREITSLIEITNGKVYLTEESQKEVVFRTMVTDRMMLPTAGSACCRSSSLLVQPMLDVTEELSKPELDEQLFTAAHLRVTNPETISYTVSLRVITTHEKPFITNDGWIGMSTEDIRDGDIIAVPLGAKVPYALRIDENGHYRFVGEAYTHGIMDGEILQMGLPVITLDLY